MIACQLQQAILAFKAVFAQLKAAWQVPQGLTQVISDDVMVCFCVVCKIRLSVAQGRQMSVLLAMHA